MTDIERTIEGNPRIYQELLNQLTSGYEGQDLIPTPTRKIPMKKEEQTDSSPTDDVQS